MSYQLEWSADQNSVYVRKAYAPNRFVMKDRPHTEEEKAAYRAKRAAQTPMQNLADLMRDTFLSSWSASDLAKWMNVNCPGYTVTGGRKAAGSSFDTLQDVNIVFANRNHAMLFKLTWA